MIGPDARSKVDLSYDASVKALSPSTVKSFAGAEWLDSGQNINRYPGIRNGRGWLIPRITPGFVEE